MNATIPQQSVTAGAYTPAYSLAQLQAFDIPQLQEAYTALVGKATTNGHRGTLIASIMRVMKTQEYAARGEKPPRKSRKKAVNVEGAALPVVPMEVGNAPTLTAAEVNVIQAPEGDEPEF